MTDRHNICMLRSNYNINTFIFSGSPAWGVAVSTMVDLFPTDRYLDCWQSDVSYPDVKKIIIPCMQVIKGNELERKSTSIIAVHAGAYLRSISNRTQNSTDDFAHIFQKNLCRQKFTIRNSSNNKNRERPMDGFLPSFDIPKGFGGDKYIRRRSHHVRCQ